MIAFVFSEIKDNVDGNGVDQKANRNTHESKEKEKWFLIEHVNAKWHIYIQLRFRSFEIMRIIQIETKEHVQVNSSAFNHSVIQHMLMVQYKVYKYTVMAVIVNDLTIGFEFQTKCSDIPFVCLFQWTNEHWISSNEFRISNRNHNAQNNSFFSRLSI